jgi:hypothetical protein
LPFSLKKFFAKNLFTLKNTASLQPFNKLTVVSAYEVLTLLEQDVLTDSIRNNTEEK